MNRSLPLIVNSNAVTEALGRDLTEDYSIVFSEQLKNAKDAGAKNVTIDISHLGKEIVITDDGQGTSFEDVENTWLTVGTTTKTNDINSLGGKGIGRLTMFALGDTISVETTKNFKKSKFKLDKNELAYNGNINSKTIKVIQEDDDKKQRTIIRITNVIVEYLDQDKIQKDLQNLFQNENEINIKILSESPETVSQEYISIADGTKYATLHSKFILDTKRLSLKHQASVNLWDKSNDLKENSLTQITSYVFDNKIIFQNIGDIVVDIYHFYEPQGIKTPYSIAGKFTRKDIQNRLLSYAGGINIYRKGTKLFGYGLNDWLELESDARNASSKISNNRTLGRILLSPESEAYLVEKSNRESLKITTTAYQVFKEFIKLCVEQINKERIQVRAELTKLATKGDDKNPDNGDKREDDKNPDNGDKREDDKNSDNGDKREDDKNPDNGDKREDDKNSDNVNQRDDAEKQEREIDAKIEFRQKTVRIELQQSYNIMNNINLVDSIDKDGSAFSSESLVFFIDRKRNMDSYLHPQDVATKKRIVVQNQAGTLSNNFEIIVKSNNNVNNRHDLFPLDDNGDHFKLESQHENNFLRVFLRQLNELWVDENYDFVVAGSMRAIIDFQIEVLGTSISNLRENNHHSSNWFPQGLNGNFSDIKKLLNVIIENHDLKNEIAEYLNYKSDNQKRNFWRKFIDPSNESNTGEFYKNKLQAAHTGAHKPQEANNKDRIESIADDEKNFLELSSAYLKVLERRMSD